MFKDGRRDCKSFPKVGIVDMFKGLLSLSELVKGHHIMISKHY